MTDLPRIAAEVRSRLVQMSHDAKAGHLGSQLSCVDILVALYFGGVLRIDPSKPDDPDRDRFILSKGHAIATQYVCLAMRGFFPVDELATYGRAGSRLPEQPAPNCVPGLECATGSLGHGLGIGVGLALAAKIRKRPYRVFVVLGDGECNEGSVWEAAQLAAAWNLGNLTMIVDANGWQGIGRTNDVAGGLLAKKWQAFGWQGGDLFDVSADRFAEFGWRLDSASHSSIPHAVVAHTTKGKGVSFMEDSNEWHYRIPTAAEVAAARKELLG